MPSPQGCSHTLEPPRLPVPAISDWGCKSKNHSPGPQAQEESSTGTLQVSLLKVTIPPHAAQSGRCHGGSQDSPLHGEGSFHPCKTLEY